MANEKTGQIGGLKAKLSQAFDGLAEDTMWSAALDLFAVVVALLSFVLITRALPDKEEYGRFAALFALASTFSAITYSGPGLALLQRRFRYNQDLNEIQTQFLSLTIVAGLLGTEISVILALWWIDLSLTEIVLVTASELLANSIIWVCSWLVQIAVSFPAMIRVRMFAVVLKLVALVGLHFTNTLTIQNLGLAYLLLYGAFAGWLMAVYLPRIGYDMKFWRPPVGVVKSSSVFAVPLAANQVQSGGDLVALSAFKLDADAGLYGAAYRVVTLGALPLRVIGQAAFHRFLPDGAEQAPGYHLRRSAQLTAFMAVVGVATAGAIVLTLLVAEPIIDLLIGEKYLDSKQIIPWLVLFLPLLAVSGTPLNGLLGLGKANERAAIYTISAVVSVLLYLTFIPVRGWNFPLVPTGGWQGAVVATLMSETFLAVVSWVALIYYQRRSDSASEPQVSHQV